MIKTQRLFLRRFTKDDWQDLYEYLSDPDVVKHEPYDPISEEQAKEWTGYRVDSTDFFAVCLNNESGKMIGNVYFAKQEFDTYEIGYVFNKTYWGKGYAREAAAAVIKNAFLHEGAHRVTANCNPENAPSWQLLERIGMKREGHLRKNIYFKTDAGGVPIWQDTYIYGMLKEDMK